MYRVLAFIIHVHYLYNVAFCFRRLFVLRGICVPGSFPTETAHKVPAANRAILATVYAVGPRQRKKRFHIIEFDGI